LQEEERKKCGVKTYRKKREVPEWDKFTVIHIKIEVSDELDEFVKGEILSEFGMTYPKWIQQC